MTFFNAIISRILLVFITFLQSTLKFRYLVNDEVKVFKKTNRPYLLAVWHQVLLTAVMTQKHRGIAVMASKSKDADAVSYLAQKFGYNVLRGSSSKNGKDKGGKAALSKMRDWVKKGHPAALTVDGPTGPAKITKAGIVKLSFDTNAPIIPYHAAAEDYWQFNSWDKFKFPKPFSRVIISYGPPLSLSHLSLEEAMTLVTQKINELEHKSDNSFMHWDQLSKKDVWP